MKKIIPITDLRNTNEILKDCKESSEPIYITKNGYSELVIMSSSCFEELEKPKLAINKETRFNNKIVLEDQSNNLGLIKVTACNFNAKINHVNHNVNQIITELRKHYEAGSKIIVFPELAITSYSCGDMFLNSTLLNNVIDGIIKIEESTKDIDAFYTFGAPLVFEGKLYNTAVCMHKGKILGVVAKRYLPNYNEFYEKRHFNEWHKENSTIQIGKDIVPIGNKLLFQNTKFKEEIIGVEICEDMWVNIPQSCLLSQGGATIICNPSGSNETLNKEEERRALVTSTCSRSKVAYIYTSSSISESSADTIFSSHNIIAEPDGIIKESPLFDTNSITTELDLEKIVSLRRKVQFTQRDTMEIIPFSCEVSLPTLSRNYNKHPFYPKDDEESFRICQKANLMQAKGLVRRLEQIGAKDLVIGVSGGLDSTLALLAAAKAFDLMGISRKGIHAITLPCFGTSKRTKDNAVILSEKLGLDLITVNIKDSVTQHLKDIDVSLEDRSTTFENAQARERTQVLMDYSNKVNGIVLGTGDLSEIALGWSTYNGDHMSMYNVNCSIPKTLVREMTYQLSKEFTEVKDVLLDILNTPVSPELLPPKDGKIAQITEDVVGPYELHDFFLYHYIYKQSSLEKVFYIAKETFKNDYDEETIKKWLSAFVKRFFNNQFKRSCSPDGPKITEVSLSPRGDFRLPSDTSGYDFLNNIK